jgi:signal transduction histidine kinase
MRKVVIASLAAGLLLTLAALRVSDAWTAQRETARLLRTRVASDALVLSEYVAGTFTAGDAALRQLALHSRRVGGPSAPDSEWAPSLASAGAGLRAIGAISVLDRDLVIRHANRPALVGESRLGDPTFAAALSTGRPDDLIVGRPFKSPITGQHLIPLGRVLTSADGSVEGVVAASFLPGDMRRFFQSISIGERGTVWVFHTSGAIVVKEPSTEDPMGTPAGENEVFRAAAGGSHGVAEGPVQPGGPIMISGFRRVGNFPLVVAVSLDREEMFAPWRREIQGMIVTHAVASIVVAGVLFVLFRQIDAKAAAERELHDARQAEAERLRKTNEQLSAMLQREQDARRDAEAANALKDQFVMTVSHELRTPLTAIAGWARMLVDGMVSDEKRDGALRTIERNAQAQKRLIEDLLDVAGIMAGKLRLDIKPIVVAEVMRMAVDAVAPAATAKGVHLDVAIDPNAGTVSADPERLQQVVWNLLANAVKFTPAGGTVSLTVSRAPRALHVKVADTGVGISAELLPHVFERFRQGGGSSRRQGGLGLGLAIVRNLVELHGGTVTAQSEGEGRGSTFDVVLPAA